MPTHEGGVGYARDAPSELYLLAVAAMVSEDSFHEPAEERDERLRGLVAGVTRDDPDWVARFVPHLRTTMYLRSASVIVAAEYVAAGGANGRGVSPARSSAPTSRRSCWPTGPLATAATSPSPSSAASPMRSCASPASTAR